LPRSVKVAVIPGDGIGPEIMSATVKVLDFLKLPFEFVRVNVGRKAWEKRGAAITDEDLDVIKSCDVVLKGPVETPVGRGTYRSVTVTIRKELGLYANVRPFRSIEGLALIPNVDIVLIRENTEGLYSGIEFRIGEDTALGIRVITRQACERILRFAFEYARRNGRKKVTAVHKANILKETCGLFLEVAKEVSTEYSDIAYDHAHVDAVAYDLLKRPERFDVIVTTNLFGDILSDELAGITGSIGVAASANVGDKYAMFEAIHGTAPDIAGKGIANPAGLMLAASMMLNHVGFSREADLLRSAVMRALTMKKVCTPDVGGRGNTDTFTSAVLDELSKMMSVV